jgi:hypothetical protein
MPQHPTSSDDDPPVKGPGQGVSTVRVPAPFPPARSGDTKIGPEGDDGGAESIPAAVPTMIGGIAPDSDAAPTVPGHLQRARPAPTLADAAPAAAPDAAPRGEGYGQHQAFHAGRAYPELPAATPYTIERSRPEPAVPVRMNKWSYRLTIYGGIGLAAGLSAWAMSDRTVQELLMVSWIPLVPAAVMQLVLVYKMWASIQDGFARTSPAKAVALSLLPLFNVYWAFEVFPGFATDYNGYLERHGVEARPLSRGLLIAMLLVPPLGVLLYWLAIGKICDAANALSST